MATLIWLSNDASDVSGYKVAYIGFRSPNASTTLSTAITGTTAAGTAVAMTATSGGTAVKWITVPIQSDVTIANRVVSNVWGLESSASANAQFGVQLAEYTTSEQSVFMATTFGTEAATSVHLDQWSQPSAADVLAANNGGTYTSTTIDAGNRLVIKPYVSNVGTMAAGFAVTMDYNGATAGADGDTFVQLTETLIAGQSQFADGGENAIVGGPSVIGYEDRLTLMDPVVQEIASDDASWLALKTEMEYQRDNQTA